LIRVAQTKDDGRHLIVHRPLSIVKSWIAFVMACTKMIDLALESAAGQRKTAPPAARFYRHSGDRSGARQRS
jgi:hypothetical protein